MRWILKSNFRKKSFKIYIIIFSILFLGIFTLASFRQYYYNYFNERVRNQAYIEIIAEEDLRMYFTEKKAIITEGIVLDFQNSLECEKYTNCKDYMLHIFPNYAFVLPDDTINSNDQIKVSYRKTYDGFENIYLPNIGQKLELINSKENKKYSCLIQHYIESDFYNYYISRELFEEIASNKHIYYYRISNLNHEKLFEYGENLKLKLKDKVIYIDETSFNLPPNQMIEEFEVALFFLSILFFIIALVIFHNIKNDFKRQNFLLYTLGYNSLKIKLYNFLTILSLVLMSMVVAFCLLFIVLKIVYFKMNLEIQVLNLYSLACILGIIILFVLLTFWRKFNFYKM